MGIYEELIKYSKSNIYPFHMPGHKRNIELLSLEVEPALIDVTEVAGTDNLHEAKDMIAKSQERCGRLFNADKSYYLINGSSSGIIASICSLSNDGGKIILARNSHKSAYSALMYSGLEPIYIYPSVDENGLVTGINPDEVKRLIDENDDICGVFITSPTYEGFQSDIKGISKICRDKGKILIVDEAHGSHFNFSDYFPETALNSGADIVIQSLHKTLPSFTQTAVLHTKGNRFNERLLKLHLAQIQSSSPSYVLMASIDRCVELLYKRKDELFRNYEEMIKDYRKKAKSYKNLCLVGEEIIGKGSIYDIDKGKFTFIVKKEYKGIEEDLLKEYNIQIEMADENHFIIMTSIADKQEGFERLHEGLLKIDTKIDCFCDRIKKDTKYPILERKISLKKATETAFEEILLKDANKRIAGSYVTPYPPGIPMIVPGEEINKEILEYLEEKYLMEKILVCKEENSIK